MNSAHLLGTAVVLISLTMASSVLPNEHGHSEGIPVLLSHRCTRQEQLNRGDGREIVVRYLLGHSGFVNDTVMPVEKDLRREIARVMATRQEQVIYLAADGGLIYHDVSKLLSDLRKDDPTLNIILLTKSQVGAVKEIQWDQFREMCVSLPISSQLVNASSTFPRGFMVAALT